MKASLIPKRSPLLGTVMKRVIWSCFVFLIPVFLDARFIQMLSYPTQRDKADLIVIAMPVSVKETEEISSLPDIVTVMPNGDKKEYVAAGIETIFEILVVLKGDDKLKRFVLHHYRKKESEVNRVEVNGPGFISFSPKARKHFLMFLKKDSGGRYSAVNGQTDPGISILEL